MTSPCALMSQTNSQSTVPFFDGIRPQFHDSNRCYLYCRDLQLPIEVGEFMQTSTLSSFVET